MYGAPLDDEGDADDPPEADSRASTGSPDPDWVPYHLLYPDPF
jgi:hypothetical protein